VNDNGVLEALVSRITGVMFPAAESDDSEVDRVVKDFESESAAGPVAALLVDEPVVIHDGERFVYGVA
jgi:hypothetical protein